jgi:hypothetical protein
VELEASKIGGIGALFIVKTINRGLILPARH